MARDLRDTALIVVACFAIAIPIEVAILWTLGALGYIVPPVCP